MSAEDPPKRPDPKSLPRDRGRFQKDICYNPDGRRPKAIRAVSRRQARRDLIEMMEEPIPIKVNGRTKMLPLYAANLRAQLIASANGKGKVDLSVAEFYERLVSDHERANPEVSGFLNHAERAVTDTERKHPDLRRLEKIVRDLSIKSRKI